MFISMSCACLVVKIKVCDFIYTMSCYDILDVPRDFCNEICQVTQVLPEAPHNAEQDGQH